MYKKLNSLINFPRTLQSCVKYKSSDKADKIIKLNYDNKYLFGAKVTEPKSKKFVKKQEDPVKVNEVEASDKKNDMSGEIYWMTQHVPVLDFTKPSSVKKPKLAGKKGIPKKLVEKAKLIRQEIVQPIVKFPDSLKNLQDLPQPVKINVKSTLEKTLRPPSLSTVGSRDKDLLDIPFTPTQLKALTIFPLAVGSKKSKTLEKFKEFDKSEHEQKIPIPSVSKVLQSTMPLASRNALIQWKTLKIAELGIEGFNMLQKCKFYKISKSKINFD